MNTTAVPSLQSSAGLKTFYNKAHHANPYATTNLLPNGGSSLDQSAFKPIQHSYMIQQDGRNPIDSGVKHDISSTDSNENGRGNAGKYSIVLYCKCKTTAIFNNIFTSILVS